ncbi:hypothetical protein AB0L63_30850 [Nocardia sp. NPDC051990]|uniref:hypothetical protein n=1 Tax=Nocardia sp. NPDC051990 TaxID=3155285 RepID=UPI00342980C4
MPDFSADLNKLVSSAKAWENASTDLKQGTEKAQGIQYSNKEVAWALFQEIWDAQVAAAQYMSDRVSEGSKQTEAMGNTLEHVAKVLMEQDQNFASVLLRLDEE